MHKRILKSRVVPCIYLQKYFSFRLKRFNCRNGDSIKSGLSPASITPPFQPQQHIFITWNMSTDAHLSLSLSLSLSHTHQLFWTHSLHLFHKHRLRDTKSLSLTLSFSLSLALSTLWQLHLRLCIPLPSKRSKFLNIWDIFQATSKAFLTKQASKLACERASKVCSWMTIYEAKGSINLWIYFNELLLYEDYKNIQIQGDQIYRFAHR